MNVNDIVTLIGSLGFPIVACVGMFYLYNRTLKDFTSTLDDLSLIHILRRHAVVLS